jgi:hypothetical protein
MLAPPPYLLKRVYDYIFFKRKNPGIRVFTKMNFRESIEAVVLGGDFVSEFIWNFSAFDVHLPELRVILCTEKPLDDVTVNIY